MTLDELERDLQAERSEPDPEFCRQLDEWAAAGFPPRHGTLPDRLARGASDAWQRVRGLGARRLVPALGMASVSLVVIGVAISQSGVFDGDSGEPTPLVDEPAGVAEEAPSSAKQAPDVAKTGGGEATARSEFRQSGGAAAELDNRRDFEPLPRGSKQAQNVDLSLSTQPEDFREAADGVLDVVDQQGGFVRSSSVTGGDPDVRRAEVGLATFELRIPARSLPAALAALSDLGNVVSRNDRVVNITSRFNDARRRIATYTEARDRLLRELEEASTAAEQESIRRRIEIVEAQLDAARDDLAAAQQRVRFVPVSVTITGDGAEERDDGAWGIGDAFDDAKRVLTVAAGVALVTLAALVPLALLVIVVAAAWRAWVRRERERALDAGSRAA